MQTFLPYPQFSKSAAVLDDRRLNKQITEAKQIARAMIGETRAWGKHPAVKMWDGHLGALTDYALACYEEWRRRYEAGERGGKPDHKAGDWFLELPPMPNEPPAWVGVERIHELYRGLLLGKSSYYERYAWDCCPHTDSMKIFDIALKEK